MVSYDMVVICGVHHVKLSFVHSLWCVVFFAVQHWSTRHQNASPLSIDRNHLLMATPRLLVVTWQMSQNLMVNRVSQRYMLLFTRCGTSYYCLLIRSVCFVWVLTMYFGNLKPVRVIAGLRRRDIHPTRSYQSLFESVCDNPSMRILLVYATQWTFCRA